MKKLNWQKFTGNQVIAFFDYNKYIIISYDGDFYTIDLSWKPKEFTEEIIETSISHIKEIAQNIVDDFYLWK